MKVSGRGCGLVAHHTLVAAPCSTLAFGLGRTVSEERVWQSEYHTRHCEGRGAQEGSGGLDDQKGILGGVLYVGVESDRYFRICEALGNRAGSAGRSCDRVTGRSGPPAVRFNSLE